MNKQKKNSTTQEKKAYKKTSLRRYVRVDFKTLQGRITIGFLLIGLFALIMLLSSNYIWKKQLEKSKELIFFNKNSATKVAEIQQMVDLTTILSFRYISTQDDFFTGDIENRWENNISLQLEELDSLTSQLNNQDINVFVAKLSEHLPKIRLQQNQALNESSYEALNSEQVISDIIHLTFLTTSIKEKLSDLEEKKLEEIKLAQGNIKYILGSEFIISLIISTLIALFIIRTLLLRVKSLKVKIKEMSEGKLPEPLDPTQDELNSIILALNELIINLKGITLFAEEVGKGQFDTEITVFDNKGHLGESLAEMRNELQNVSEKDKQRVWFNEGIAKFGDILRKNEKSIEDLSSRLIAELVNYTEANQGSIFITNKADQYNIKLVLKGAYAYDRKKHIEKEIAPGQGLIGQAYLEKDHILLSEIPAEYIAIKSGLGEASPSYILISPMKLNEEIFGVIEIASFHPFKDYHIDFIEKVGESIASTIQGLQVSIETQKLLEESQMKAEQLQAQEEEMRQNAEEMEATQEEMERQSRESTELNLTVNQSVLLMEIDTKGTILNINDQMVELLEYNKEELLAQNHRVLAPNSKFVSTQMDEMNQGILEGKSFSSDLERVTKSGQMKLLRTKVIPIFDQNRKIKKITLIATDISDLKR